MITAHLCNVIVWVIIRHVCVDNRHRNPNEEPTVQAQIDAYEYFEIGGGADMMSGSRKNQHQHQQLKAVAGGTSVGADKRKRQVKMQSHRPISRRSSSSNDDDSDEFDGGDEYDSAESLDAKKVAAPMPTTVTVPLVRKPFWDTYDSINQLYLEIGEYRNAQIDLITRHNRCILIAGGTTKRNYCQNYAACRLNCM